MKLLFLLQEFPFPPSNGVRWKCYSLLRGLAATNKCDVLSFGTGVTKDDIDSLSESCPGISILGVFPPAKSEFGSRLKGLLHSGLPSAGCYNSAAFEQALAKALSTTHYDLVHIDMINLVQYGEFITNIPVVLSVNDAVSLGYANSVQSLSGVPKFRAVAAKYLISRYEQRAFRNRVVHVVTEIDKAYLQEIVPSAEIEVIELPVDPLYLETTERQYPKDAKIAVVIPANFSAPGVSEDTLAFLEASSRSSILSARVVYQLIGKSGSSGFISKLQAYPSVEFVGWVHDFRGGLGGAEVVVVPERRGGGTKTRVLHAMALGKAVIMSGSAAQGVGGVDGDTCLICESSSQFTSALESLIENLDLARTIGLKAREAVRARFGLDAVISKWNNLYFSLAERTAVQQT